MNHTWRRVGCAAALTLAAIGCGEASDAEPNSVDDVVDEDQLDTSEAAARRRGFPFPWGLPWPGWPRPRPDAGPQQPDAGRSDAGSDAGAPDAGGNDPNCPNAPDATEASFTYIKGYQNLSKPPTTGPEAPVLETHPSFPDWTVYRPKELGNAPHPVLVWANGGCLKHGTLYGQFLLEAASHGFIVVADGKPYPANSDPAVGGIRGGGAGAAPQVGAIDWILAENERPCSPFYRKVDTRKIAVSGQSCGGMMSLAAAGDPRVTTAIINNSGLFARDAKLYTALHTPIAYFIGGPSDVAYGNANADFAAITGIPVFYGNLPVGHGATWEQTNAGEFGRVNLAWLKWQLLGDQAAGKLFGGPDCELCKPPSKWTVQKKGLE